VQHIDIVVGDDVRRIVLPDPDAEWSEGRRWGDASFLLTPAWIAKHAHMRWLLGTYRNIFGSGAVSLPEELVFCLLSGFGIKAEIALAAFRQLRGRGLFAGALDQDAIERELSTPVRLESGRSIRYRFPRSRAAYIHEALTFVASTQPPASDLEMRRWLLSIRGIGPKTASFIVRNHLGSDRVAILDVHVLRAGRIAGIFPREMVLPRDYAQLEGRFLAFADAAGVPASHLDMTVWDMMRRIPASRLAAAEKFNRGLSSLVADAAPRYHLALSV